MNIAKIVSLPEGNSQWATVRDAYGNNVTVNSKDLPKDAKENQSYAYQVDFIGTTGSMTLKKFDTY